MTQPKHPHRPASSRAGWPSIVALAGALLAGCQSSYLAPSVEIDPAQGSQANIASLTTVVEANPDSPEAYNVRGTAYGRAGRNREALADFTRAIELNPRFHQAYANRALIHRQMDEPEIGRAHV